MKSTSATILTGFLASLIAPTSAFFRVPCPGRLVDERADPIVCPGEICSHVHGIAGGNRFGFNMTYEDARESTCSSCPIQADLSNYWFPMLYYRAQNGTFISVPVSGDGEGNLGGLTVYYLQRPGPNNDTLHAFPEGFRMLAGNPFKRNFTGDFAAEAISYNCLDYSAAAKPETNGFPDYNCADGLRAQVFFPSCWDGVNLDSPNHESHVSYPESGAYNNGACPSTHPVHLISIFYEVIFQTNLFADMWWDTEQPFVWSFGDPTGYGFHGDFVNGWNVSTLQYAVDNCLNLSGEISDCLAEDGSEFFELFPNEVSSFCTLPDFVDETIHGVLDKLPGCNEVVWGPEPATIQECVDNPTITDAMLEYYYTDLTETLEWQYTGCAFDNVSDRALSGPTQTTDDMTVQGCIDWCSNQGYSFAGVEYSTQCYCGNSLPVANTPIYGSVGGCLFPCAGNSTQMCGGAGALSLYHNCKDNTTCTNANIGVIEGANSVVNTPSPTAPIFAYQTGPGTGEPASEADAGSGSASVTSSASTSSATASAGSTSGSDSSSSSSSSSGSSSDSSSGSDSGSGSDSASTGSAVTSADASAVTAAPSTTGGAAELVGGQSASGEAASAGSPSITEVIDWETVTVTVTDATVTVTVTSTP